MLLTLENKYKNLYFAIIVYFYTEYIIDFYATSFKE